MSLFLPPISPRSFFACLSLSFVRRVLFEPQCHLLSYAPSRRLLVLVLIPEPALFWCPLLPSIPVYIFSANLSAIFSALEFMKEAVTCKETTRSKALSRLTYIQSLTAHIATQAYSHVAAFNVKFMILQDSIWIQKLLTMYSLPFGK